MKSGAINLSKLSVLVFVISLFSCPVFGQNPSTKPKPIVEAPATSSRLSEVADETFVLDIDERRLVRENFEVGTEVGTTAGANHVNVRVGVSLNAGRIEVLLRNVQGNVRFRGTLDRILKVIERQPVTPTTEVP